MGQEKSKKGPSPKVTQPEPIDQTWDDEGVFPSELTPDSEFLFERMTSQTLAAVEAAPGELILDVGCGRAHDLLTFAPLGARLIGFDGSLVMARKARAGFVEKGQTPRLVLGSAERLPFADNSLDKVFCKGAIDHFYDPETAIAEMLRVVRPGGAVVISVANFENLGFRLGRRAHWWLGLFRGRGFKKPHFWDKPHDHVYEFSLPFIKGLVDQRAARMERPLGLSMFWGFPKWGPWLKKLPPRTSGALLKTLDRVARLFPGLADVLVIRLVKRD